MIPLIVRFNLSTICALCPLCVANSLILISAWQVFIMAMKKSVPLFACITFGPFIVSQKIHSNTFLIAILCFDLGGSNHVYLDKISITNIIKLNPSLCFKNLIISTKSICQLPSIQFTMTGPELKLRRISLCKIYGNWDFNNSSTSFIGIFESCFFTSLNSLDFPA